MIRRKRALAVALALATLAALTAVTGGPVLAQSGNMWHVDYYPNTSWSGNPCYSQDISMIWFDWSYGGPQNCPVDNFTARMTTDAYFYGGQYQFTVQADDDVLLLVDGVNYLDTRDKGQSGKSFTVLVSMYQGTHHIQVDYREWSQTAYVFLNWYGPTGGYSPPPVNPSYPGVPSLPPSPPTLVTNYGDYTPCMQQKIHQVNCFQPTPGVMPMWDEGSIAYEPQIQSWSMCGNEQVEQFLDPGTGQPKDYKCSKTDAGWFPN